MFRIYDAEKMEYRITERLHGEIEARDTEERYLNTEKQKEVPM